MKKSFFSTIGSLAMCALMAFSGSSVQAAPDATGPSSPQNIKNLNQLLTTVRPDNMVMVGGDELVPAKRIQAFRDRMVARAKGVPYRATRSAFEVHTQYWTTTHIVPYIYDNLPASEQASFEAAAREWEKYINIKFVPRTSEANYVRVFYDSNSPGAGYSNLGMTGGEQGISLPPGFGKFATAHEIGHMLGLDHEHQRSDRDSYITVHYENVAAGSESQYTIISDTDNHGAYDFESIMHYFDTAFSVDGVKKTMVCKPGYESHQSTMGYQRELTITDRAGAADIYGYPMGVTATPRPTPTLPPRPTLVCDPITVKEGDSGTTPMTFRVMLSYPPTKDVSFSYKVVRYHPVGVSDTDLDKYSAIPGEDYSDTSLEGTITLPAATTDNQGNSTREADISVSINGDTNVENDESLMLVLSDPLNARFANEASTLSVKGTIQNDDFDTTPTATPITLPTATPVPTTKPSATATPLPTPVGTPRPTATPKPGPAPSVRVTLSPSAPPVGSLIKATLTYSSNTDGTTATLLWRINDTVVASNITTLNLARFPNTKPGDAVSVTVTPYRGQVVGTAVTARVVVANTAPVANKATAVTRSAVPVSIPLSGSDVDRDPLTFALSTRPVNGTATVSQIDGKWTLVYRSKVGFIGSEALAVVAYDGKSKSAPATIQIKVNANTSPQLTGVSPSSGSFPTGTKINFTQTVADAENNVSTVVFLVGSSSRSADARNGVSLVYTAATKTVQLVGDDGKALSEPVAFGVALENTRATAVLQGVSTNSAGTLSLRWQITPKPGWTGTKTLWGRAEDAGTLIDGPLSLGTIIVGGSAGTS